MKRLNWISLIFLAFLYQTAAQAFSTASPFNDLPNEIVEHILLQSNPTDWPRWIVAQKKFKDIILSRPFIKKTILKQLNEMKFITVPAGEYVIHYSQIEDKKEYVYHYTAKIAESKIQSTEVSQLFWFLVMYDHPDRQLRNPSHFKNKGDCPKSFIRINGTPLCPYMPVHNTSWNSVRGRSPIDPESQAFFPRLNAILARTDFPGILDLSSEAEWDVAAAGAHLALKREDGSLMDFGFGEYSSLLDKFAWFKDNSHLDPTGTPFINNKRQIHDVATRQPNALGGYDFFGNVYEWVRDGFRETPDPTGIEEVQPLPDFGRVTKGGCAFDEASLLIKNRRTHLLPDDATRPVGFRMSLRLR